MRQRVSMARALISSPRLLFLDEPTSGLDPSGAVLFRRMIEKERQKGTTVFVTTHNMLDTDLLCDRVAFISGGNIVAVDTPYNLKELHRDHDSNAKDPTLEDVFIRFGYLQFMDIFRSCAGRPASGPDFSWPAGGCGIYQNSHDCIYGSSHLAVSGGGGQQVSFLYLLSDLFQCSI